MSLLQWDDKYSVKVEEIDKQHKGLIDQVNKLHNAMKSGHGSDVVVEIIDELIKYSDSHFVTEENYMKEANYPQLKDHRQEHIKFREEVEKIKAKAEESTVGLSLKLLRFISEWLTNHFAGEDQKYVPYIKKKD